MRDSPCYGLGGAGFDRGSGGTWGNVDVGPLVGSSACLATGVTPDCARGPGGSGWDGGFGVLGDAAIEDSRMSPENVRAWQYEQGIVIFGSFGLCLFESSPGRRPFSKRAAGGSMFRRVAVAVFPSRGSMRVLDSHTLPQVYGRSRTVSV